MFLRKTRFYTKILFCCFAAVCLASGTVLLSSENEEVRDIRVEGNKTVKESEILDKIEIKKGDIISLDQVNEDIKALFELGYFKDVMVDWQEERGELKFMVTEKPRVKRVEFKGNQNMTTGKLKGKTKLKKNEYFDEAKLKEDIASISGFYKDKGYVDVRVEGFFSEEEGNRVIASFFVEEGKKVLLSRFEVFGVASFSPGKIRKLFTMKQGKVFKNELFEEDLKKLKEFYRNRGFFEMEVTEPLFTYDETREKIFLTIHVFEGEKFSFSGFGISGNREIPVKELERAVEISQGEIYKEETVLAAENAIREKYAEKGYLKAQIRTDYEVDREKREVRSVFRIEEGDIVYVNKIYLEGNAVTRDYVIKREFEIKEGDPLSVSAVRETQRKIYNLGFFSDIRLNLDDVQGQPNLVDLIISLEEQKTGIASLGAGYSSDSGMLMNMQVSQKNLFGKGQSLSFLWEIGEKTQNYQISFYEPWFFNKPYPFGFSVYNLLRKKEYVYDSNGDGTPDLSDWYEESNKGGDIRIGRYFKKIYSAHMEYSYKKVRLSEVDAPYMVEQQEISEENGRTSAVKFTLKRDSRDNYFDASKGTLYTLSSKIAGGILGGDNSFHVEELEVSYFLPLVWKFVFGLHTQAGKVAGSRDTEVPIYEKFYVGGAETIRGYDYRGEIGPAEGGNLFFLNNAEIGHTILQGAFFFDLGGAWRSKGDIEYAFGETANHFKRGWGMGIRFKTPVFPIRLDWGKGLDHRPGEAVTQWYFTIGQLF